MAESFAGRVVAVAGAAEGIGRAIAERFAQLDAKVLLIDGEGDALARAALETGGTPLAADPADPQALTGAFREIERLKRLDAYVHAAPGVPIGPSEELQVSAFEAALVRQLTSAFHGSQCAGRLMLAQGWGAIVHLASVDAVAPRAGHAAAAAAQAGLLGLTRALGVEWSARGVRVNAIAFGVVEGEPDSRSEASERYRMRTPMGRFGKSSEVAEAAVFLSSDEAKFITAECLRVDGGWLAYSYFFPAVANSEHR